MRKSHVVLTFIVELCVAGLIGAFLLACSGQPDAARLVALIAVVVGIVAIPARRAVRSLIERKDEP